MGREPGRHGGSAPCPPGCTCRKHISKCHSRRVKVVPVADRKIAGVVCGRKFCSRCGRWRYAYEFNVQRWWDEPVCTEARALASFCRNCLTVYAREKNGYGPRAAPISDAERRRRNRLRSKDPDKRKLAQEYKRIWRDARRAQAREYRT